MSDKPFISSEERPDLTVDLNARVGDLTVRQLSEILSGSGSSAKLKELPQSAKEIKEPIKEPFKEQKDIKDQVDSKAHKDPKDHKDQKDNKDHKDPKDQKDQKDQKDPKDHKDQKDNKDHKDPKDPKDHKDQKDHKDPKDTKDHKDIKDRLIEKHPPDKLPEVAATGEAAGANPTGLDEVIQRISHLEQEVAGLAARNPSPERRSR
jgi:hypothetical protein